MGTSVSETCLFWNIALIVGKSNQICRKKVWSLVFAAFGQADKGRLNCPPVLDSRTQALGKVMCMNVFSLSEIKVAKSV